MSARPTRRMTMTSWRSMGSGVLHRDAIEHVADVLAAVGGRLQMPVELLPLDDLDRVLLVVEQRDDRLLVDDIAFVLQPIDLRGRRRYHGLVAERLHRLFDLVRLV